MRLKWFVCGIIVTLVALSAAAYVYFEKGFVDSRADIKPGAVDVWLGTAMDASTRRHAPNTSSPVPDTPENLLAGAKVYRSRCTVCHGGPDHNRSRLGESFSPPAPQFFADERPDLMESENFYIIRHGIRMTAMPAWDTLLSEQQIWQTVQLLKHINDRNIPSEIQQELQSQSAALPPTADPAETRAARSPGRPR